MAIHEFTSKIEVDTPLGRGFALFVESIDSHHYWTVILFDSRAIVTFKQKEILAARNYSMGWGMSTTDMKQVLNEVS